MSTEINLSKRISAKEEGVVVTPNVNSLDFVGAGVNVTATGNDVKVTIPGSTGSTIYYLNQSINQAPYKEFSSVATAFAEQIVPATVAGGATATIASFQTISGVPGTTVIPAGLWQMFLHFNAATAGQNWIIRPFVYKRDLAGIETLILTLDPEIVTNMSTTTGMYACDAVLPTTSLLATDRLVVKIDMQNTSGVSQTVNFRTEGSQHYSVVANTLNQSVPVIATPTLDQVTTAGNSTTNRVTIGGFTANGNVTAASSIARGGYINNTLIAAANNDVLVGLDIAPTFTNGAFTGVSNIGLRVGGSTGLVYDMANGRLGIGGTPGAFTLDVVGAIRSLGVSNFRGPSNSILGSNLTTTASALFYQNTFSGVVALGSYANSGGEIQSAQNGGLTVGGSLYIQRQAGNVIIGSSTDAGFKLDVNGTARVSGNAQFGTGFYWDNVNNRLGINKPIPLFSLDVLGATCVGPNTPTEANAGFIASSGNHFFYIKSISSTSGEIGFRRGTSSGSEDGDYKFLFDNASAFINYNRPNQVLSTSCQFHLSYVTAGSERGRWTNTGNFLINTTTDAGFKLDVNGTARIVSNTRIGTTVYSDASSGLVIGETSAGVARGTLASPTNYQDFQFINTNIASGNINSWAFGQRQDTYFGNALGSFQIIGSYINNSGTYSMVGGGFRVPLICNPNGDIIISGASNSINGNVSVGSSTVVASALLSVTSTTKGFLPPRMTTTQKNAIASPVAGLMVYDTTLNLISVYNGTIWISL